jgi:hypothetical protein
MVRLVPKRRVATVNQAGTLVNAFHSGRPHAPPVHPLPNQAQGYCGESYCDSENRTPVHCSQRVASEA